MPSLNSVSGRFDLVAALEALATETVAVKPTTPVAKAMKPLAEDHTYDNARRVAKALFTTVDSDPTAHRKQVLAYTAA